MLTTTTIGRRYWKQLNAQRDPLASVLFFPFAGGGVDRMRALSRLLPAGCDSYCFSLPRSHDDGAGFRPPTMADVAASIARELPVGPERPLTLVGISVGALLALKVASYLGDTPRSCVLIAQSPAGLSRLYPAPCHEDDYLRLLDSGGAIDPEALVEADVRAEITRRLRAAFSVVREEDIRAVRTRCAEEIFYAGGASDPLVPPHEMAAWHELALGQVSGRIMPGGHFFAFDGANEEAVRGMLEAAVGRAVAQRIESMTQEEAEGNGYP